MSLETSDELRTRLEFLIKAEWNAFDPSAVVSSKLRPDGKIDVTVVSEIFTNMDGMQRETYFWKTFRTVPKQDLIRMTYGLLMTPEEATTFSTSCMNRTSPALDEWEE